MNSTPLLVGQIGVGGFGNHRRKLMRQTGLFRLVAAYDLNPVALEEAVREDGCTPVSTYEDLLKTPGLQAVVISTGAKYHASQVIAALERGLPVFVEKPLCCNEDELEAIFKAKEKYRGIIGVGHKVLGENDSSIAIKKMIDSGELGTIAAFEKTAAHSGGLQIRPGDWRGDAERNPGGFLFQCGVHSIHELCQYFGPVSEVSAVMRYDVHTTHTADVAHCLLTFKSGVTGTLNAYHVTPYRHTLSIFGTKGSVYREERYFDEGTSLLLQRIRLDNTVEKREVIPLGSPSSETASLISFYEAVVNGGEPSPSLADGARAVMTVFKAEQSARERRPVSVPIF